MKDTRVSLLITAEMKELLKRIAATHDRSVNYMINAAIKELIEKELKEK